MFYATLPKLIRDPRSRQKGQSRMLATSEADRRKAEVWARLDALGRSRPHLLLEGDDAATYVARWRNSPVPAHVLAGRLRCALPGSTILHLRSWPGQADFGRSAQTGRLVTRYNVTVEFTLASEAGEPEEAEPCADA